MPWLSASETKVVFKATFSLRSHLAYVDDVNIHDIQIMRETALVGIVGDSFMEQVSRNMC